MWLCCRFFVPGHFKTLWGQVQGPEPSSDETIVQRRQPDRYKTLQRCTVIGQTAAICPLIPKAPANPQQSARQTRPTSRGRPRPHEAGVALQMLLYDLPRTLICIYSCRAAWNSFTVVVFTNPLFISYPFPQPNKSWTGLTVKQSTCLF